ncbi:MAG: PAS domain-containing protein [Deltaproteobacteria bacterium]|nr:PAS domain-containing protein [Deltaproteobacteria bacterium]
MTANYIAYAAFLPIAIAANILIIIYAWPRRQLPGGLTFICLIFFSNITCLAEGISILCASPAMAGFWYDLRFIGLAGSPVAFLVFALDFGGNKEWLRLPRLLGLLIIPLLTQVMVWTNTWHGLWLKQNVSFQQIGPFLFADTNSRILGPWFWVHSAYGYLLLLIGIGIIFRLSFRLYHSLFRKQAMIIWVATLIAILAVAFPTFKLIPAMKINPFVFSLTLANLMYAWSFFQYGFLELIPIARDALINDMDDCVLVLDGQNRIVDINPSMSKLLPGLVKPIGQAAEQVFAHWPGIVEHFQSMARVRTEITMKPSQDILHFDLLASSLTDRRGQFLGRLFVLRDITERKRIEAEKEIVFNELQNALSEIKTLRGIVPICANCKKIRDDDGFWHQVEKYVQEHSLAKFSHGICPDCARLLYPELYPDLKR